METKVCNKCGIEKPLTDFELRKDTGSYRNACKKCVGIQHKKYLNEHKEYAERKKIKREENKAANLKYYEEHKNEIFNGKKVCNLCGCEKELNDFYYRKDEGRFTNYCKQCKSMKQKEYDAKNVERIKQHKKEYREQNKEHISMHMREYWLEHRDERLEYQKARYNEKKEEILKKNAEYYKLNKEKIKITHSKYVVKWLEENKERINLNRKYRRENDPVYKLGQQVRTLINNSFRRKAYKKGSHTYEIVGCDFETMYNHLLKTYKDNYGYEWDGKDDVHIDHIVPLATANTEEEIIELCYYKNLQLLKAKDNLEKNDKLDWSLSETKQIK